MGIESLIRPPNCRRTQRVWLSFCPRIRDSNNLNAARMSAAGEGLTEPLLCFIDSRILLHPKGVPFALGGEEGQTISMLCKGFDEKMIHCYNLLI